MIAATEGSDDSCVSGVEIAEGPAQQALSDPIPPRGPLCEPGGRGFGRRHRVWSTRTRLRRLARMVHQPWNFRIGTLDPKLRGVDVSSALATVATSGGDRCRCRGCCPDNVGDQTPCENPCPTREPRAHRRCGCGRLTLHVCAVATQRSFPASARLTPASTVNTSRFTSNRPVAIELNLPQPSTRRFGPTSRYCSGHCNFRLSCEKL